MRDYSPLFLMILLKLLCVPATAQQYLFDAELLTTEDGLANLMTTSVYQDQEGFMWMGTSYGLNSYDGYAFKLYTKEEHGLHNNRRIREIKEDEAGNLWLFYLKYKTPIPRIEAAIAIDIFNKKTERVIPIQEYFSELPFKIQDVNSSYIIDPKKRLWLTTTDGELFLYEKGTFQKIYTQKGITFQYVTIDERDNICLGYGKEVICINPSGKLLAQHQLSDYIFGIWEGEDQTIWLATALLSVDAVSNIKRKEKIFIWEKKKDHQQFERFPLYDENGTYEFNGIGYICVHRDRHGFWHINENDQNLLFDASGSKISNLNNLLGIKKMDNFLFKNYEDENYMWWGSTTGVLKTSIKKNPFHLIHQIKDDFSDSRGITEDELGNIYFLNKAVYKWVPKNNNLSRLTQKQSGNFLIYKDSTVLLSNYNEDTLGIKINLSNNQQITYKPINGINIFCALPSKQNNKLLIGTNKGLEYIDIEKYSVLPFPKYKNGNPSDELLKKSVVNYLHQNTSGIWAATNNGIFLLKEDRGIIRHFDRSNSLLPFNEVMHIYEEEDGVFWLATKGGGVLKWQYPNNENANSSIEQFTTKNGLSNNYLYAIYEDDYGRLWIPSDRGIMCMDKKTHQILKTYLVEDGLPHNEFNTNSHYQSKDGTLYFGGLGGIVAFHPQAFNEEVVNETPMAFTRFFVLENNTDEITDKSNFLKHSSAIEIRPDDKFIELQFALLDFDSPEHHQYAYKIEGYSDQWQYINENRLRITTLPYGKYMLKVKGQNLGRGWSNQELALKVNVLKPFYLQWWFIALGLLVIIGFIKRREIQLQKDKERLEAEVQKRTQTIQQQATELKELDRAKTRFFSNITHEFRTPLTLIIGPLEQLLEKKASLPIRQDLFGISKNARHLLTLINQMLDLSKLEGGKMQVEVAHGDIVDYTNELILRFQPLAKKKHQQLSFKCTPNHWETYFDKNKWNKIIYNLVSNAIKFTPEEGEVEVQLSKATIEKKEAIRLIVKDTGVGIEKEALDQIFNRFYQEDSSSTRVQEGTGIGLSLVKELVELQGGRIRVKSEIGEGTTFAIELPILKEETSLTDSNVSEEIISPFIQETSFFDPLQTEASISPTPAVDQEKEKLNLLLIEDNDEMRAYIRACIEESKYEIMEARNGEEGIDLALTHVPDLIISDVMMPKKNGFEVVRAIRANLMTSHIPVILLTAKASLESRLEGFQRGADAYLTKPFSAQELVLRIQKLIEIRRLLQARYRDNKDLGSVETGQFAQEDAFIIKLKNFIIENLNDPEFNGKKIGKHFGVSRTALYHKIKALTGQAISEYIRFVRLEVAYRLIQEDQLNLSEIAYETGFSSLSHFSRTFKKAYRKSPSEIKRNV